MSQLEPGSHHSQKNVSPTHSLPPPGLSQENDFFEGKEENKNNTIYQSQTTLPKNNSYQQLPNIDYTTFAQNINEKDELQGFNPLENTSKKELINMIDCISEQCHKKDAEISNAKSQELYYKNLLYNNYSKNDWQLMVDSLQNGLDTKGKKLDEINIKLIQKENEFIEKEKELNDKLIEKDNEINNIKIELKGIGKKCINLEKKCQKYKKKCQNNKDLESENYVLMMRNSELEKDCDEYKEKCSELENECNKNKIESNKLSLENSKLIKLSKKITNENVKITNNYNELKRKYDTLQENVNNDNNNNNYWLDTIASLCYTKKD